MRRLWAARLKQHAQEQAGSKPSPIRGSGNKAIVLGMLERGGKVKAKVVASRKKQHIDPVMTTNVEAGSLHHHR